ncbi:MAG: TonB-dependent receptor [Bacteroidales bacterium]|nr:TonB-dependent receptor [Bacteroidales bacterium]
MWPYQGTDTFSGTTYEANFVPVNPNKYNARSGNTAAYLSTELSLFRNFRAIIGLRAENYTQRYTGQDQLGTNVLNDKVVLDNLDFFPQSTWYFNVSEKQNVRFSYGKTIARPSFKEMSYAEISDPISNRTFIGGMFRDADDVSGTEYWDGNLVNTYIQNLDVRWEWYHSQGQMISLSGFYKMFENPIEIVQYATTMKGSFQPRNVGDGQVIGVETEFRQNLDIVAQAFENFSLTGNISFTSSRIDMSLTEYQSRVENARAGQTIEEAREMAGQAPLL